MKTEEFKDVRFSLEEIDYILGFLKAAWFPHTRMYQDIRTKLERAKIR